MHQTAENESSLVSIVIACYNCASFLGESIESALQQTHRPIEVIVVDDGSSDSSAEIAQKYPVRFIRQENKGVSAARNSGLRAARGSEVLFLDADDRLLPRAVEIGLRDLERHPECVMTVGDHRHIAEDGSWVANLKSAVNDDPYLMLLEGKTIETVSAALYRRSILDLVGGFNSAFDFSEDYELYFRVARHSPISRHHSVVAEYRLRDSGLSRNSERMLTVTLQVIRAESKYLQNDRAKLNAYHSGLKFWRRKYGRQLTLELARGGRLMDMQTRDKLYALAREYPVGVVIVLLARFIPPKMVEKINIWRLRLRAKHTANPSSDFRRSFAGAQSPR